MSGEIQLNFDTTENCTEEMEAQFVEGMDLNMERARMGEDDEFTSGDSTLVMEADADQTVTSAITKSSKTSTGSKRGGKKKPMTKGQLMKALSQRTGQPLSVIKAVMTAHEAVGVVELKKTGSFKIPGLTTLNIKKKPAKPERYGYNPLTRQHQTFQAKPASMGVKARADTKMKKYVKPIAKPIIWDAKARKKLEDRINTMQIRKSMSASQIIDHLTLKTNLPRHEIEGVFDKFGELCIRELATRGTFRIPDIASLSVRERAAMPERQGLNPFTKQMTTFKARPATKSVKATINKGLRSICYAFTDAKSYASSTLKSSIAQSDSQMTEQTEGIEQQQEEQQQQQRAVQVQFPMKKQFCIL